MDSLKIFLNYLLIPILSLSITVSAVAEILNIPEDHETIQAGIDASEDGDTVLVQPDVYVEVINFSGKAILLTSLFLLEGDESYIDSTIIDGDHNGRSIVVFNSDEDENSILSGFTIRNGETDFGGGIYCSHSSPTITHCIIRDNTTSQFGGGIYITQQSAMTLANVRILNNSARGGGGLSCASNGSVTITNSVISGNSCGADGGGIRCWEGGEVSIYGTEISGNFRAGLGAGLFSWYSGHIEIDSCNFTRNQSNGTGSGIYIEGSTAEINRTLITRNRAIGDGGGVSVEQCEMLITNSTLAANVAHAGSGVLCLPRADLTIHNSILRNIDSEIASDEQGERTVSISWTDIRGGEDGVDMEDEQVDWGDGNIDQDPEFVDPEEGDFRLGEDSPCIDAGDPESGTDPDGSRADMGALYYHQNFSPEVIVEIGDIIVEEDSGLIEIAALDSVFTDANGDELSFSWQARDSEGEVTEVLGLEISEDNLLTMEPAANVFGEGYVVTVLASDGENETGLSFTVTITPLNDPPAPFHLLSPADSTIIEMPDQPVVFQWEASTDPDPNDQVHYELSLQYISDDDIFVSREWTFYSHADSLAMQFDTLDVSWSGLDLREFEWFVSALSDTDRVESAEHFRTFVQGWSAVRPEDTAPLEYDLSSIYPNPFNSLTRITFTLPFQTIVSVAIYDNNARIADLLLNRTMPVGRHSLIWDASGLTTGVYFVRIRAGIGRQIDMVRKVVLIN